MGKFGRAVVLYAVCSVLLSACHSAAEQRQQYLDEASAQCTAFGFKSGTPDFANCVQTEYDREQEARERALNEMQHLGTHSVTCTAIGGAAACY